MLLGTAPVLALVLGAFHTALYVLIRGTIDRRLPLTFGAAVLGAWAGDAIGGRLGLDPFVLGEFRLLSASLLAWLGIAVVAVVATLGPQRDRTTG